MAHSSEWQTWYAMRARCQNPNYGGYRNYGGRGITVCERWRDSFENFYADMGPRPTPDHTLDREDNDGPYSPENCRWAEWYEQANNKRTSKRWTYHGATMTQAEWAAHLGMTRSGLWSRVHVLGWSVERALSTKRRILGKRKKRTRLAAQ